MKNWKTGKKFYPTEEKKIEKQLEKDDKDKKFKLTMAFNSSLLHDIDCIIGEINFLIDYCNMKEDSSFKATNCVDCKKFGKCKVRENTLCWGFGQCGLFEQKENK